MAVCSCSMGNWSTGRVNTNVVQTENVRSFLGMTSKTGPNGFWPEPTVTDFGVIDNANWASIAAAAVATINTIAALDIAQQQYNVAKRYYNISKKHWQRFMAVAAPCELQELSEACRNVTYTPRYTEVIAAYTTNATAAIGRAFGQLDASMDRYCLCKNDYLYRNMELARSVIVGDSANFARRYEERRKITKEDVQWNRRSQALNRGRDLMAQSFSNAKAGAQALGEMGDTINDVAQGAMRAVGYFGQRNTTSFMSKLGKNQNGVRSWGESSVMPDPIGEYSNSLFSYNNANTIYDTNAVVSSTVGQQTASGTGA